LQTAAPMISGVLVGGVVADTFWVHGDHYGLAALPAIYAGHKLLTTYNGMSHDSRAHTRDIFNAGVNDVPPPIRDLIIHTDSLQYKDLASEMMQAIMENTVERHILAEDGVLDQIEAALRKEETDYLRKCKLEGVDAIAGDIPLDIQIARCREALQSYVNNKRAGNGEAEV
jgi:hypothetical protein